MTRYPMDRHAPSLYHVYGSVSHTALTSPTTKPSSSSTTGGGGSTRGQSWTHYGATPGGQKRKGVTSVWGWLGVGVDRFPGSSGSSWSVVADCVCRNVRLGRWALRNSLRNLLNMDRQKSTSLGALVLQTSVLALTIRYSRTEAVTGPRYLTSTAVVMSELLKLVVCLYMALCSASGQRVRGVWQDLTDVGEAVRTAIPAALYTLQNNLQFVAVSHLDAATFQVTYQLKILTTALFSVVFLGRQLDSLRWSSLVMLTAGVALVQLPDPSTGERQSGTGGSSVVGVAAVLAMCLSSGCAGVYFEKILKSSSQSIWAKNVQMAFVSVWLGVAGVVVTDGPRVAEQGFFQGYNTLTLIIILQQAVLGLIISMVMKYADNILKGFASAISIILTSFISCLLLQDLHLSCSFLMGTSIVLISALLYNVDREADKHTLHTV
ncbi:UDP-N-acetylglucosamine transporter-like [Babylonia areolata]|uniref:UDP-N-acetylglucosamine transporter-like n=1 Tax=Babylonia areolata TaxID=304850 RepID=UPI003FD04467